MMHTKKYPKDTKAARYLTTLLDQRRHLLNYLVEKDFHRYKWICTDYGIPEVHAKTAMHRRNFGLRENTYKVLF
jgi:ribosomal protein S15P/S13E